jgi:hypothetical protein
MTLATGMSALRGVNRYALPVIRGGVLTPHDHHVIGMMMGEAFARKTGYDGNRWPPAKPPQKKRKIRKKNFKPCGNHA